MKIPVGTPWACGKQANISDSTEDEASELTAVREVDAEMDEPSEPVTGGGDEPSDGPNKAHKEKDGFDGDRVHDGEAVKDQ